MGLRLAHDSRGPDRERQQSGGAGVRRRHARGRLRGGPPTGNRASISLIDIMRFDDVGLICEHWGVADMLPLMQQPVAYSAPQLPGQAGADRMALTSCQLGARKEAYEDFRRRASAKQSVYSPRPTGDLAVDRRESTPGMEGDNHRRGQVLALLAKMGQEVGEIQMLPLHDGLASDAAPSSSTSSPTHFAPAPCTASTPTWRRRTVVVLEHQVQRVVAATPSVVFEVLADLRRLLRQRRGQGLLTPGTCWSTDPRHDLRLPQLRGCPSGRGGLRRPRVHGRGARLCRPPARYSWSRCSARSAQHSVQSPGIERGLPYGSLPGHGPDSLAPAASSNPPRPARSSRGRAFRTEGRACTDNHLMAAPTDRCAPI